MRNDCLNAEEPCDKFYELMCSTSEGFGGTLHRSRGHTPGRIQPQDPVKDKIT